MAQENIYPPLIPTNPIVQFPDDLPPEVIIVQNGWTPELSNVIRTNEDLTTDVVQQVIDWIGGFGAKPQLGLYVGSGGYVIDIDDATSINGISLAIAPETDNDFFDI